MKSRATYQFGMGILIGMLVMIIFVGGAVAERIWGLSILKNLNQVQSGGELVTQKILTEESMVTEVAERVSPAVVTVSYKQQTPVMQQYFLDPFGMFGGRRATGEVETEQVDIGSGFIVDKTGLVVTNKHVVSQGQPSDYKVVLKDDKEYQVEKIWRDPVNDLAILKISSSASSGSTSADFPAVEMGNSGTLRVGNFVVAIGTALGEFRHTVTTGVISGLGRGITAGDGFSGVEKLDNVIQTDAAINPGNSGGPLLNSAGQVIGVNVAVSQSANNIGFALPINVVRDSLKNFNETGQFDRPFFGVRYQMVNKEQGILNNVPAGAYVVEIVAGSSAEKAGIQKGDIVIKFGGQSVVDNENGLVGMLSKNKIGDRVEVEIWRDGKSQKMIVELKGE
ncbi:MAG: 2-alkenal reductase [uncultured bacterium]|nr:MAG: 2-alkenal reductase [uncultured bacterium]KKU25319.1 MAG: 2-alkenal reductase [Microgenomates group bacterium GW2011_GWA2_46_16]